MFDTLLRVNQSAITLLNTQDRSAIERIVAPFLVRRDIRLKLFGSRARGDARRVSDIDLALIASQPIPSADMALLREAFDESRIPFRIDLVDYASAPYSLRSAIDREGISWPVQTSV
jgi:predicted nucleotidyltransferase